MFTRISDAAGFGADESTLAEMPSRLALREDLLKLQGPATEALRKWASKYPNDPELARSYYLAVLVLRKVYTQPEQQVTWEFMHVLAVKYGNTYFGKTMKATIAQGYTEHWLGLAQICPTPPLLDVMPEATPNATPVPSPAPGRPEVEIITPPCVPPSPLPDAADALIRLGPSPSPRP